MNELERIGRKRTLLIFISIIIVSIHTIYFFHVIRPELEVKRLVQQIIRFLLTIGLLIVVYKGKRWAIITSLILFSLAILGALSGIFAMDGHLINKIPLMVMVFVYAVAIYHFGFSESFKAFISYQNDEKNSTEIGE